MKITVIGAAGVRSPLLVQAMAERQERLGLDELALMDIDAERLELTGALSAPLEGSGRLRFRVTRTTDPRRALDGADYVITTFRVGGIASRVVDERVPLEHGVLGQETTGPGGFAMGMRSIPVLLGYIGLMREHCPKAWLVNFANPSGLLAEAALGPGNWQRTVGICDTPRDVARVASAALGVPPDEVFLDYFGLNHLGWVRRVLQGGRDHLPQLIQEVRAGGGMPWQPFSPDLLATLGMIPNEYLYYYYSDRAAVRNLLAAGQTRGEQVAALNERLFSELRQLRAEGDTAGMQAAHRACLGERRTSYMAGETGQPVASGGSSAAVPENIEQDGYAYVALDLIEALAGRGPRTLILNLPNAGAVRGMGASDVVEVPAYVAADLVRPLAVGDVPAHCLGLMQQVKAYELLTVAAATQGSYAKALTALAIHPLVRDQGTARSILDGYVARHAPLFPELR